MEGNINQEPSFGDLVPKSVGIHAMRWEGNLPVNPHCHDYLEIALLEKGSCLHAWQGVEVRLVPGDLFVITPGETHAYRIEGETTIYNCLFYPSGLGGDWAVLQHEPALQHLLVLEAFAHIDGHVTETLSLDQLASRSYLSPGHFRKLFREETGLSPSCFRDRSM